MQKDIIKRISRIEADQKALGERIRLVYTDGHTEETKESLQIRVEEVGIYIGWKQFVDGYSDTPPDVQKIIYLDTGEEWDFESDARKPPMTQEEVDAIIQEIEEAVGQNGRRYKTR